MAYRIKSLDVVKALMSFLFPKFQDRARHLSSLIVDPGQTHFISVLTLISGDDCRDSQPDDSMGAA